MHIVLPHICTMSVYKVMIEHNRAVAARVSKSLEPCEVGLSADHREVKWIALECVDKKTAMLIADKVVRQIWGNEDVA